MSVGVIDPKIIESIPLEILSTLPAGDPPPGIQPNFSDPPTLVPALLGVPAAFLVLAVLCFFVRIYTKVFISKRWGWDDYSLLSLVTCSLGFVCSIVYFGATVNAINAGIGRHLWDLHLDKALDASSLYQDYITTVIVTPALGFIKCSLFIQYYQLFRPWRWVRISVWIGATISVAFYAAVTITAFVLNSPWPGESLLEDILSWHYVKFTQLSIPTGVIGMLIDWYLFILPIKAVLMLKMSPVKKLGVLILFMTGGLAAIASTISLYYRVNLQRHLTDAAWNAGYVLIWGQIEMFTGVAVSSMPTVNQFLARHKSSITSWRIYFRNSLPHLLSRSSREKISDDNFGLSDADRSKKQASKDHKAFGMSDLESSDYKPKIAKIPRTENSQILVTQEISITQESIGV